MFEGLPLPLVVFACCFTLFRLLLFVDVFVELVLVPRRKKEAAKGRRF